jgi:hypothetical protein
VETSLGRVADEAEFKSSKVQEFKRLKKKKEFTAEFMESRRGNRDI